MDFRATVLLSLTLCAFTANAGEFLKLQQRVFDPSRDSRGTMNTPEKIVQFETTITEDNRRELTGAGLKILGYLPDDALVVSGSTRAVAAAEKLKGVRAVVPYLPEYKLSAALPQASVFVRTQMERLVIQGFIGTDAQVISKELQKLDNNIVVLEASGRSLMVMMPMGLRLKAAAIAGVEHIQADPEFRTMEMDLETVVNSQGAGDYSDLTGDETGTRVMGFDTAYAQGFTGKGQIGSMADTGLDSGDPASLYGDFKGKVTKGYYFGLYARSWEDPMGHGTHVAGSIVGTGAGNNGKIHGGAFEAGFIPESLWSPMLGGLAVPSKLADLFQKASDDGARVHSNSWGTVKDFGGYDSFAQQADEWMFNHPDTLVLFAAGNSGVDKNKDGRIDGNSIGSPGTAKNVLTVGASENVTKTGGIQAKVSSFRTAPDSWPAEPIFSSYISDNASGVAMFSSRGPTKDNRLKPEIVAPGTNILSNRSHTKTAEDLWGKYNENYVWAGGTSMATPLTSGAALVTRQILTTKTAVKNPSASLLKAVLMHNATEMFPGQYGEIGAARGQELLTRRPNTDEGYGRVDVAAITNHDYTLLVDERAGVGTGEEKSYDVQVGAGGTLLANLVYNDAPASPNAASTLVNDLDILLVSPSGQEVGPKDRINNNEIIELSGLPAGTYKLRVRGEKVPSGLSGRQPFALVVTAK